MPIDAGVTLDAWMRSLAWPSRTLMLWISLLVVAQAADLATTAASLGGGGLEVNPIVMGIVAGGGIAGYALAKLASMVLIVVLLIVVGWLRERLPSHLAPIVFRMLIRGVQAAVGIQVLASAANLVVLVGLVRA